MEFEMMRFPTKKMHPTEMPAGSFPAANKKNELQITISARKYRHEKAVTIVDFALHRLRGNTGKGETG
jgi:hypothetical protein